LLQLAETEPFWSGPLFELNLSFDSLRNYQWERLLRALWATPSFSGPLSALYHPGKASPPTTALILPDPTATYSQFGIWEVEPDVRAGIEVLVTRSLFECMSVVMPVIMFANVGVEPEDAGLQALEKLLYDLALNLYQTTAFSIAAIGIDRGCQLLMDFIVDSAPRSAFVKAGNFLARDDTLAAIRLEPRVYKEVMPSLRWCPPRD
jgi:hypothetical protein